MPLPLRQGAPYNKTSQAEAGHLLHKYAVRGTLPSFIPRPGTEAADLAARSTSVMIRFGPRGLDHSEFIAHKSQGDTKY